MNVFLAEISSQLAQEQLEKSKLEIKFSLKRKIAMVRPEMEGTRRFKEQILVAEGKTFICYRFLTAH